MTNQDSCKKYDLDIKPKDVKEYRKPLIFEDDSSSDDDTNKIETLSFNLNFKKQDTSKLEEALKEDPSIFDYDGIFEQVSTGKSKLTSVTEKPRPKYAHKFIESAQLKNMRTQITISKKAKLENEVDRKDVFVTSAYKEERKKLLELDREDKEQEEREKKHELSKTPGTSAIYRYMLDEKMNMSSKANVKTSDNLNADVKTNLEKKDEEVKEISSESSEKVKEKLPEQDEIVIAAIKAKMVREKAALLLQKPDPKRMLSKFTKKNDSSSIQNATERYLQRKNAAKRPFIEEDSD